MRIRRNSGNDQNSEDPLEVFVAQSGVLSARINGPEGPIHLHSAIKPESEPAWFGNVEYWGDLIVFLGTGLGHHVAPSIKAIPPGAKIVLVDYYQRCIDHCLKNVFNGLSNVITVICSGAPGWKELSASTPARTIQIIKHPASYNANKAFYDGVLDALPFKRSSAKVASKALLFYGNFFLEEELRRALAKACPDGVSLFTYNDFAAGDARYESELCRRIQEDRPEYILSVNMKGFDNKGIVCDTAFRMGVPVVTWFVDDPHAIMLQQRPFIKNNMVALSWERAYLPWLSKQGFGGTHYLPLAADPSIFAPGAATEKIAGVGFVGSSMGRAFLDTITSQFLWQNELEPMVVVAAKLLLEQRKSPVRFIIEEACRKTGIEFPFADDKNSTWLCSYIIHTASMLLRRELITACLPLGIRTFGDPEGWKALIGNAAPTWPDIDYRNEIGRIYRAIDININITSCQMPTAVNQRVFDVPLCDGFIINDHQPDLDELFASDETVMYRSKEELIAKIGFFSAHETERAAIAQKARTRVLAQHTYSHRIASLRSMLCR